MDNIKEAKFILDVFLTSPDEREFILTNYTAQELRGVGAKVFRRAARQLLERGDLSDARDAFRSALLMKNKVLDPRSQEAARGDAAAASAQSVSGQFEEEVEQFDICVFFDNDSPVTMTQELEDTSKCLATAMRDVFGMRYLSVLSLHFSLCFPRLSLRFLRSFLVCVYAHMCVRARVCMAACLLARLRSVRVGSPWKSQIQSL